MIAKLPTPFQVFVQAVKVWWDEWLLMVAMSLIWFVSWLTILFGPPVTFAYYYLAQKLVDETYPDRREIFNAGKQFFAKSWVWMVANVLVFVVLSANYLFYGQIEGRWTNIVQSVIVAIGLLWIGVQFYALPYYMLQERKSLRTALRNGLFTVLAAPIYTIVLWILAIILGVISIGTVLPFLLGIPGIIVILGSQAVAERVETYQVLEREAANQGKSPDKDKG